MARSALSLAALASSAMPEVTIAGTRGYSYGERGDNDSAVLTLDSGAELLVRVPTSTEADTALAMEVIALAALTPGVRSLLPFAIPSVVGGFAVTDRELGQVRAVVSELMPGLKFRAADLTPDALLVTDIARALAAVHRIPGSAILEAGLPVRSAKELRDEANTLLDRAAGTRLVPATVLDRWQDRIGDAGLWQFQSTVVHGSADDDAFLVQDDRVTGLLNWSRLRVADPAADFSWLSGAATGTMDAVIDAYIEESRLTSAAGLRERASLYAELEIARWLLHGVGRREQAVIDDAVLMLDTLVERIARSAPASANRTGDRGRPQTTTGPLAGAGSAADAEASGSGRAVGEAAGGGGVEGGGAATAGAGHSALADTAPYNPFPSEDAEGAPSDAGTADGRPEDGSRTADAAAADAADTAASANAADARRTDRGGPAGAGQERAADQDLSTEDHSSSRPASS